MLFALPLSIVCFSADCWEPIGSSSGLLAGSSSDGWGCADNGIREDFALHLRPLQLRVPANTLQYLRIQLIDDTKDAVFKFNFQVIYICNVNTDETRFCDRFRLVSEYPKV